MGFVGPTVFVYYSVLRQADQRWLVNLKNYISRDRCAGRPREIAGHPSQWPTDIRPPFPRAIAAGRGMQNARKCRVTAALTSPHGLHPITVGRAFGPIAAGGGACAPNTAGTARAPRSAFACQCRVDSVAKRAIPGTVSPSRSLFTFSLVVVELIASI